MVNCINDYTLDSPAVCSGFTVMRLLIASLHCIKLGTFFSQGHADPKADLWKLRMQLYLKGIKSLQIHKTFSVRRV